MCTVAVSIPDELLFGINMTRDEAAELARQMTALGLWRRGDVSLGYCAQVAGMPEEDFMVRLGSWGESVFRMEPDELERDLAVAEMAMGDSHV